MKAAIVFVVPAALILFAACADGEDSGSLASRSGQIEESLDVLALDVGAHLVRVGTASDMSELREVETLHYVRTVEHLADVERTIVLLGHCMSESGASVDTAELIGMRWAGQLLAAIHEQTMGARTDTITALQVETAYQGAMMNVIGNVRAELATLDGGAATYTCGPSSTSQAQKTYLDPDKRPDLMAPPRRPMAPAPDWLLGEEMGPAVPAPPGMLDRDPTPGDMSPVPQG